MKSRKRLGVEYLEGRWCPALTATLSHGTLTIAGTADNGAVNVAQDSATAGTITVTDGDTAVTGSPFTGVTNIRLRLTDADDTVAIDLGGQTLSGSILALLGGGADSLTVTNGAVGRRLSVAGGNDDDTVTLGDGTAELTIRDAELALFGGLDTITVSGNVTVSRSLSTFYANTVTLEEGSTAGNVFLRGGTGGNTFTVAGDITGGLTVDSFFFQGSEDGTTLEVSGEVDGSVRFRGSDLDDSVTITGAVGGSVSAATASGADKVSIDGAVTRGLSLDTGADDDDVTVSSTVGGRASISTGSGNDTLTVAATAQFLARATISMGAGDDSVTLDDAATIATMLINGGTGTDTFTGTATRTGLTLVSF